MSVSRNWSSSFRNGWLSNTGKLLAYWILARNTRPIASLVQDLLQSAQRRLPAEVLMNQQRHARSTAGRGHLPRHFQRRPQRFLADHGQLVLRRQMHELGMRIDVGDAVDEVQGFLGEHLARIVIHPLDPEPLGQLFGLRPRPVVDRHAACAGTSPQPAMWYDAQKPAPSSPNRSSFMNRVPRRGVRTSNKTGTGTSQQASLFDNAVSRSEPVPVL